MQAIADKSGDKRKIAPWDYRYYAEKVRKAKYDLDENEVKPYLQLEKLREGMFWVAGELLGFVFVPLGAPDGQSGVEIYHPDVRVWEVKDGAGKSWKGTFAEASVVYTCARFEKLLTTSPATPLATGGAPSCGTEPGTSSKSNCAWPRRLASLRVCLPGGTASKVTWPS